MKNWWLSWYATPSDGPFELEWPWWCSGYRCYLNKEDEPTIVAAVQAESEEAAKEIILAAHDRRPATLEWRFCEEQSVDFYPFSDRFPRADWMQWPPATIEAP